MNFGEMLEAKRNEFQLSKRAMCDAIGVSSATYYSWYTGRRMPGAKMLKEVCGFLGVDAETFEDVEGREIKPPEIFKQCPYNEDCCMRNKRGECEALNDVTFEDGRCHFRKKYHNGPNLYDRGEKALLDLVQPVRCGICRHRVDEYTGTICAYTRLRVEADEYCSKGEAISGFLKGEENADE